MKKYGTFGLLFLVIACTPSSQDADFKVFIKSFHQSKWKQFPLWAAQSGHKEFDKILLIPNRKKHESDLQFYKKYHDSLQIFDTTRLSVPLQFEYNKIKPYLTNQIRNFEIRKIYETDPTYYDLRGAFDPILKNESTPIEQRLEIVESKLKKVPEYYSAAIENLKAPDHNKLHKAIDQQIQFYNILDQQIISSFQNAGISKSQLTNLEDLTFQAKISVKDFIAYCKSAAFEHLDKTLNDIPPSSPEGEFEKVFTLEK